MIWLNMQQNKMPWQENIFAKKEGEKRQRANSSWRLEEAEFRNKDADETKEVEGVEEEEKKKDKKKRNQKQNKKQQQKKK